MSETVVEQSVTDHSRAVNDVKEAISTGGLHDPGRRRRFAIVGGLVLAVICSVYGIRYLIWSLGHEETDDAYLTGHIHPISSRVTGTVSEIAVDDNQHVDSGQILFALDPNDYKVRFSEATAALSSALRQVDTAQAAVHSNDGTAAAQTTQAQGSIGEAGAAIKAAQASVSAAESDVPKAKAQLQAAQASEARDKGDLERYEDLVAKEQVSRQMLDHARASYQIAVGARIAAEQQVSEAEAFVLKARQEVSRAQASLVHSQGSLQAARAVGLETKVREAQLADARERVAQASATLEDARLQLGYTVIKAPIAGRIGRKGVELGQRVQVGQPLMAVVQDSLWVVANFKETQMEKMRTGQAVEIKIDTFPKHTFTGHVDSLAPGSGNEFALLPPDNATGNFTKIVQRIPVKIVLDQESVKGYEGLLSPGMSSVVTVATR